MYDPLPHLPRSFQKAVRRLKTLNFNSRVILIFLGIISTIWFLVRVIPKPSRAYYPCMKATAPFMSAFIIYLFSLAGSVLAFKTSFKRLLQTRYYYAFGLSALAVLLFFISQTQFTKPGLASSSVSGEEYFAPNSPIGEAKGIFPGRVVWSWNPDATNENCTNTSNNNGVIDPEDDAWFMEKNNNQQAIDSMLTESLMALTGEFDISGAWDAIFRHYNLTGGNGDTGYQSGQKIFVKINATSAYGSPGDNYFEDLSRNDDTRANAFAAETNPFLIISVLNQLINIAMIPQENIYIGDPARNLYKWIYELLSSIYPDVNYLGNDLLHPVLSVADKGRLPVETTAEDLVFYSDKGSVMPDAISDRLFTIFEEMDYLINIPTIKAHSTAGITLAAKNHFGSFTRQWAMHLHSGLMKNADNPERIGYGLYRVQTDIMMHNLLSGKNLLLLVDGLYPGEDALGVPYKWESTPFNNDWCSSLFVSLDPVALESVCHDFLRAEYNGPTIAESRPNWYGVDDYLHQAADSALWPDGIVYDPDRDGILIPSLGVHEHWNNPLEKKYSRNLNSGDGIELVRASEWASGLDNQYRNIKIKIYPNPAVDFTTIENPGNDKVSYIVYDSVGKEITRGQIEAFSNLQLNMQTYQNGIYLISLANSKTKEVIKLIKTT